MMLANKISAEDSVILLKIPEDSMQLFGFGVLTTSIPTFTLQKT